MCDRKLIVDPHVSNSMILMPLPINILLARDIRDPSRILERIDKEEFKSAESRMDNDEPRRVMP
jgi:hypothetical protein